MAAIPPISAQAEVDIEDSCNCCWGPRRKKERKLTPAEQAFADKISSGYEKPRDVTEVFDLIHVEVHSKTPEVKHVREHTTYPKEEKK